MEEETGHSQSGNREGIKGEELGEAAGGRGNHVILFRLKTF